MDRMSQQCSHDDGCDRKYKRMAEARIERLLMIKSVHYLTNIQCFFVIRMAARALDISRTWNHESTAIAYGAPRKTATHLRNREPAVHLARAQFLMGCGRIERVVTLVSGTCSMLDPRDFRLRSVLWIVLATISVAALLRYALHDYAGLLGEDIRVNALLGAAVLGAALMATFFYRVRRR
jgi:hypothetical protein